MKLSRYIAIGLLLIALPVEALAHQVFLSSARIAENPDRQISVELRAEGEDLAKVFKVPLTIRGGIVNPHELKKHQARITKYLLAKFAVANAEGNSCSFISETSEANFNAVALTTKWDCKKIDGELFYQTSLFFDESETARHLAFIKG